MALSLLTFSPLELCARGDYESASQALGLTVGEWPDLASQVNCEHAEAILVAGVISSALGKIQQRLDPARAREMIIESVRLFGNDSRSVVAQSWLALADYQAGDLDGALTQASRLLDLDLDIQSRFRLLLLRSSVYWCKGKADQAFAELVLMEPLYDQCSPWAKGTFHHQRGLVLRTLGETDRAILDYDAALHFFEEAKNLRWQAATANNLSHVYLVTEQFDRAHEYAAKARNLFHKLGDRAYEAKALDQEALIYLAEGKLNEAQSAISSAIALVEYGEVLRECLKTDAKINVIPLEESFNDRDILPPRPRTNKSSPNDGERSVTMAPQQLARHIIENHPANATALLDLLIWATSARDDAQHEAELDEVEEWIYGKTEDGVKARAAYRGTRLLRVVPVTSADS